MKRLLICFSMICSSFAFTQINTASWGIEDTVLVISKTTDYGPVHDYLAMTNNSGQDLNMRWIAYEPQTWPNLWITDFTDPQNSFADVQHQDSSDFILYDPPEWNNKLIIGVQHQSFANTDTIKFKVFPVDFPQDSLWLYYVIEVAQGNAWANTEEHKHQKIIYHSNAKLLSLIDDNLTNPLCEVYNLSGQLILSQKFTKTTVSLNSLQSGIYIVQLIGEGYYEKLKILVF